MNIVKRKLIRYSKYKKFLKAKEEFYRNADSRRVHEFSSEEYPCLYDNTGYTGFEPHYTYHPIWAFNRILNSKPDRHTDIGSILHFSTYLSNFIPTDYYDIRPADIKWSNLNMQKGNLCSLPIEDNSIISLSCMHTVEHVGLGRYGDDLNFNGDIKAISELKRVLAHGGLLYFVVPVGKPKIMFNAHRIYTYKQIISYFNDFQLMEASLIPDNGHETGIIFNATEEIFDLQEYGCGCFCFMK